MNIAGFAVRNWQFTLVLTLLFAALGYNAFQSVPRTEDPSFNAPFFTVITIAPGMEATEVEKLITDKIEDAFNELDDVKEIEVDHQCRRFASSTSNSTGPCPTWTASTTRSFAR